MGDQTIQDRQVVEDVSFARTCVQEKPAKLNQHMEPQTKQDASSMCAEELENYLNRDGANYQVENDLEAPEKPREAADPGGRCFV